MLENVKNLKTHDRGHTFSIIQKTLEEDLGYTIKHAVLNTMEYGNIPQNRERIAQQILYAIGASIYVVPQFAPLTATPI